MQVSLGFTKVFLPMFRKHYFAKFLPPKFLLYGTSLLLASNNICQKSSDMLNKNTLGINKVRGQSEAALQTGMCDQKFDIS